MEGDRGSEGRASRGDSVSQIPLRLSSSGSGSGSGPGSGSGSGPAADPAGEAQLCSCRFATSTDTSSSASKPGEGGNSQPWKSSGYIEREAAGHDQRYGPKGTPKIGRNKTSESGRD